MSNSLSPELLAQLFSQESEDPFLTLVTLTHEEFASPIRLVNNSVDVISRGMTFTSFPMTIAFPVDDGETARVFKIEFDNVGLTLIEPIREVTTPISVVVEMILASLPDEVQIEQGELLIQAINYTKTRVSATIALDNFLNTAMTSERYTPLLFPGLF